MTAPARGVGGLGVFLSERVHGGDGLTETDAAVIGRHETVREDVEARRAQSLLREAQQQQVLEDAA